MFFLTNLRSWRDFYAIAGHRGHNQLSSPHLSNKKIISPIKKNSHLLITPGRIILIHYCSASISGCQGHQTSWHVCLLSCREPLKTPLLSTKLDKFCFNIALRKQNTTNWVNSFDFIDTNFTVDIVNMVDTEVNISSYPGTRVPGLFFHSRAVIFKSGCFVQKYWSGTVTLNAVMLLGFDQTKPGCIRLHSCSENLWCS